MAIKDPDLRRAYHQHWRNKNRAHLREYKKSTRTDIRAQHLKQAYNMSVEDYDRMYSAQSGLCTICSRWRAHGVLVVDHDHETNKVRSLLCASCNIGIGHLQDNAKLLLRAAEYLLDHGT